MDAALGRQVPGKLGFEGLQGLISGVTDGWRKQTHHSQRAHTKFHTLWDPGQKQSFEKGPGRTHLLILEGLPKRQEATGAHLGGKGTGKCHFGILQENQHQDPAPPRLVQPVCSSAGTPQAKQLAG